MLTTVHNATDVRIFHREAKTLNRAGFVVSIVGPHPATEQVDGILIDALPRASNRLQRLLLSLTVIKRAMSYRRALFIFHDPELFGVGLLLRALGEKVVYDSHENLPMQILQKSWLPLIIRRFMAPVAWIVEGLGSRLLNGVLVVGETYTRRFPKNRTVLVRNFTLATSAPIQKPIPIEKRRPIVIYAGGLSRIRGIAELVKAFAGLEITGAELWLVGTFDSKDFEKEILVSLPPNVKWLGCKTYPEVLELYQEAKIGAVLHHDAPNHRGAIPIKLLEFLAAGLPVIASNLPQFEPIIQDCGLQVEVGNIEEIRNAFRSLLSDNSKIAEMSRTARQRASKSYSWATESVKLIDFCAQLVSPRKTFSKQ